MNAGSPFDDDVARLIKSKSQRLSRRGGFTPSDREDIEQELRLHLWRQLSKFDPSVGTWLKWTSFILDKKGVSLLRHQTAEQRNRTREECSLNNPVLAPISASLTGTRQRLKRHVISAG